MKGRFVFSLLLALASSVNMALAVPSADVMTAPPQNEKDFSSKAGLEFAKTAAYKSEFQKAVAGGKSALIKAIDQRKKSGDKACLAIVSDIDETLLDNREYFKDRDGFDWDGFVKWMDEARAPVLKPTADLLAWARKQGVAIFLVTGRPEKHRKATIENLIHDGVAYDGLYLRPTDDHRGASEVKSEIRKSIEAMGFKIVLNIGDQYSDLAGGVAVDCEKLPNKMYLVK